MKKLYCKPGTEIIDLEIENVILAGSDNDSQETPVSDGWTPPTINGGSGSSQGQGGSQPIVEEEEW